MRSNVRRRAVALLLPVALAVAPGCRCGGAAPSPGSAEGGGASGSSVDADAAGATASATAAVAGPPLSAPVAAAHVGTTGAVLIAGLSVPRRAIVLFRVEPNGNVAWTADAIADVAWASDADLRVLAADDGASFVVWRGKVSGKARRVLVAVSAEGKPQGTLQDVGAGSCATDRGVVWSTNKRVFERGFHDDAARELLTVHGDADPILVCGASRAFVLAQRDESLDLEQPHLTLLTSEGDLDHYDYTAGDVLGVVRPGAARGTFSYREVKDGAAGAWQPVTGGAGDEEVATVDGDEHGPLVVTTREEQHGCGDDATETIVRALRPKAEPTELARLPCGVEAGPFFTGVSRGAWTVAWPERPPKAHPGAAPIAAVSFVRLGTPLERRPLEADAVADAGCTSTACYAVALTRPAGTDGMVAGNAVVLRF